MADSSHNYVTSESDGKDILAGECVAIVKSTSNELMKKKLKPAVEGQ